MTKRNPVFRPFLQIGSEHVNVTDEIVARIETMVQTEWEEVVKITAAYTEAPGKPLTRGMRSPCVLSFSAASASSAQPTMSYKALAGSQAAEIVRHFVTGARR